jgi:glucose-1-phosphate thymidylyltransferase
MLEANRLVLEELQGEIEGELLNATIEGAVEIDEGAVLENTVVRGPAVIGAGSRIRDSYIGPNTSIGEAVTINSAEIENSIVLAGCTIEGLGTRIEGSLLGRNATLRGHAGESRALRLMVGDNSEIAIP